MTAAAFIILLACGALMAIPAYLGEKSKQKSTLRLGKIGLLAEAEVVNVVISEDAIIKFKFLLPDQRTTITCTYALPLRYKHFRTGDRIPVRYNPKCPTINRLEPETVIKRQALGSGVPND